MVGHTITTDQTFKLGVSLTKGAYSPTFGKSFEEILENKAKEVKQETEKKASEATKEEPGIKTKKDKNNGLPDISKLIQNKENKQSESVRNTYNLLEQYKSERKLQKEDPFRMTKQKVLNNPHAAGNALIQPVHNNNNGGRRASRSQILSMWEKLSPTVTEDPMKKAVRIDIPLVNDVQALVLRMHPDRSISASLLGSEIMKDLIKKNKDKLEKTLKYHHLTLKEFNTYIHETDFTSYSGTKKKKHQKKKQQAAFDLI